MNKSAALDDIDRSLISALVADGRATYATLAPAVGLSQAAVRARVQRLLDERLVIVTGRVDPASLGLGVFAFAFLEVDSEVDKTAARIAEIDEAVFAAISSGRFDLLVELRCADDRRLTATLDRVRGIAGVRRLQSATVLHYEKQDWTGIGNRNAVRRTNPAVRTGSELDEIDRLLLRELIADGRATYAALAPTVGLSQAAVRERVIDLIGGNVIRIEAHPVPEAMGIGGFSGIAVKAVGPVGSAAEAVAELAESTVVARTLGRFDVLAELWYDDHDHLAEVLDRLRAVDGIGSVDTMPYLRIAKEQFGPGSLS